MNPTNAPAEVNLSEEIRNAIRANPNLTAKPAIEQFAARGITINAGLFNTVKFHFNKDNGTPKAAKSPKAKKATPAPAPAPQNVLTTASLDAVTAAVAKVTALAKEIGPDVLRKIAQTV